MHVHSDSGEPATLLAALDRAFTQHAARIALEGDGRRWTYAELGGEAARAARAIRAMANAADGRVGFLLPTGPRGLITLLAIWRAGQTAVGLNPDHPETRLRAIAADAGPTLVVSAGANLPRAVAIAPPGCPVLDLDNLPSGAPAGDAPPPAEDAPAALFFTSGSTGQPKGVISSRARCLSQGRIYAAEARITPADRHALYQSLATGWSMEIALATWLSGAALLPFNVHALDGGALGDFLARERVTILALAPTLLRRLLAALPAAGAARLPDLRAVVTSGEALAARDLHAWRTHSAPDGVLTYCLGSTEGGIIARTTVHAAGAGDPAALAAFTPMPGVEIRILDDNGRPLPPGADGEIAVRSRTLFSGYWRRPDLTAVVLAADGDAALYRTGDAGRLRADGRLELTGRRDDQVKVRGYTVQPAEIEQALYSLAGIRHAAVLAHSDPHGETRLVAYIEAATHPAPSTGDIRSALAHLLPEYMIPVVFIWLDAMPLNAIGKVDRARLPDPRQAAPDPLPQPVRSALEQHLAERMAAVLGAATVGRDDDFFVCGGDSLRAAQLLAQIEREWGRALQLVTLAAHATPARLAALLSEDAAGPQADLIVINEHGALPPLFCVPWSNSGAHMLRPLAAALGPDQPVCLMLSAAGGAPNPFTSVGGEAAHYAQLVRRIQPRGPYRLLGYSYGAYPALETARLLREARDEVAFLGVLDSGFAFEPLPARLARKARRLPGWLRRRLGRSQPRPPAPPKPAGPVPVHVVEGSGNAERFARYRPRPYNGRVVFFRTTDVPSEGASDPLRGWGRITGRLRVIDVPGDHTTMLYAPHVATLAREISAELHQR